jgi:Fe-S-cluster-containing dehydrogenase component
MLDPVKPIPEMFPKRVKIVDWSDRKQVQDRLTPYNWLFIQTAEVKVGGETKTVHIPRRCMHCQNPPCADLCPWGAASKSDQGITVIDKDLCLGGAKCQQVCPWQIPQRQSGVGPYLKIAPAYGGNGVMFKCHRCHERLAKGETPACVEICPEGVQTIGPRDEIVAAAHKRAKEIGGYVYGEHENGGTNTLYVSPAPFDLLNQAIAKGDGKPHLGPVKNTMAQAENLSLALLIAPLAGAAAAFGKVRKTVARLAGSSTKDEVSHE